MLVARATFLAMKPKIDRQGTAILLDSSDIVSIRASDECGRSLVSIECLRLRIFEQGCLGLIQKGHVREANRGGRLEEGQISVQRASGPNGRSGQCS